MFRRTVVAPVEPRVGVGTRVATTRGRESGHVREVLLTLPSGRTSYAIEGAGEASAPVLLLPREAIRHADESDLAVVDERALPSLRRSA